MLKRIVVLTVLAVLLMFLLRYAGSFLVVNNPEHSDVIVVLGGGNNDLRYWNGVRLMQEGYAPRLILDVFSKGETFGNMDVDLARDFVTRTTPGKSTVCSLADNSTYEEAKSLGQCLAGSGAKSILVVTSNYHTRRAMSDIAKASSAVPFLVLCRARSLLLRHPLVDNAGMGENQLLRVAALPVVATRGPMEQRSGAAL